MMSRTKNKPKVIKIWSQRALSRGYCKVGSALAIKTLDRLIMTKRKADTMMMVMPYFISSLWLRRMRTYLEDISGKEDKLGSAEREHPFVTSDLGRFTTCDQPLSANLHEDY